VTGTSLEWMTVDIYGHLVPGANRAAVDRLDAPVRIPDASDAPSNAKSEGS
jgi:hypothetical protein